MDLTEVERRKVARGADRRAGPATDAGLQFGHFAQDLVALAEVVAVEIDGPGLRDRVSEIDRRHRYASAYRTAASAAAVASFNVSPMLLGAVTAPA